MNAWGAKQADFLFQPALLESLFAGYCMGIFSIFERFLGHHLLCPLRKGEGVENSFEWFQ